jgi:hypothetical protein
MQAWRSTDETYLYRSIFQMGHNLTGQGYSAVLPNAQQAQDNVLARLGVA